MVRKHARNVWFEERIDSEGGGGGSGKRRERDIDRTSEVSFLDCLKRRRGNQFLPLIFIREATLRLVRRARRGRRFEPGGIRPWVLPSVLRLHTHSRECPRSDGDTRAPTRVVRPVSAIFGWSNSRVNYGDVEIHYEGRGHRCHIHAIEA